MITCHYVLWSRSHMYSLLRSCFWLKNTICWDIFMFLISSVNKNDFFKKLTLKHDLVFLCVPLLNWIQITLKATVYCSCGLIRIDRSIQFWIYLNFINHFTTVRETNTWFSHLKWNVSVECLHVNIQAFDSHRNKMIKWMQLHNVEYLLLQTMKQFDRICVSSKSCPRAAEGIYICPVFGIW